MHTAKMEHLGSKGSKSKWSRARYLAGCYEEQVDDQRLSCKSTDRVTESAIFVVRDESSRHKNIFSRLAFPSADTRAAVDRALQQCLFFELSERILEDIYVRISY